MSQKTHWGYENPSPPERSSMRNDYEEPFGENSRAPHMNAAEETINLERLYQSLTHLKPGDACSTQRYIPRCLDSSTNEILKPQTPETASISATSSLDGDDFQEESKEEIQLSTMEMIREHHHPSFDEGTNSLSNDTFFTSHVKLVRFGKVNVREYRIGLGDNPACLYGPPVSLSWKYRILPEVSIDRYELSRMGRRRSIYEMHLNCYKRELILRRAGIRTKQMKRAVREVSRVQWQRNMTNRYMTFCRFQEWAGSLGEKLKCRSVKDYDSEIRQDPKTAR